MKIFKYGEFVNEEKKHFSAYKGSRSESLDHIYGLKDIEKLLEKYAPYFLEPENIDTTVGTSKLMSVYRGVDRKGNIALVKPSSHDRVSRNTENYYTLVIDDTWRGFPKRNKSLICSTSKKRAESYGEGKAYVIIPLDKNALFGIASESDIWESFSDGISELNNTLKDIFQYTYGYQSGIENDLNDLNSFLKDTFGLEPEESLESIKDKLTVHNFVDNNVGIIIGEDGEEDLTEVEKLEDISIDGSLYHIFEKALSLEVNEGFKLVKFSETNKKDFSFEKEIWTDADCLMIESEAFSKWMCKKFYTPTTDKYGWSIKDGLSTDPKLKTDEERRKRVEDSK